MQSEEDNLKTLNALMFEYSAEMLALAVLHRIMVCVYEVSFRAPARLFSLYTRLSLSPATHQLFHASVCRISFSLPLSVYA